MGGVGPSGAVSRRVGWFSPGLGGIQGLGPGVRWESSPILLQSSWSLSSSLPSSLPRKIPARKLGVCGGLSTRRGCGSLPATPLPPRFPPCCEGQLLRLSWQGWPGSRAGETASGAQLKGRTARHRLQQHRKENSERLRDPEIINVRAGRSLPRHRPTPRSRQGVGPGREGDCSRSHQGPGPTRGGPRSCCRPCSVAPPDCPSLDPWGLGLGAYPDENPLETFAPAGV